MTADPRLRAGVAGEYTVALQAVGRHDDAFVARERAIADVAAIEPSLALSLEASLVGSARFDLPRLAWARARLERHRSRPPESTGEWRLRAMQVHLDAFSDVRGDSAHELAELAEPALIALADAELPRGFATTGFFAAAETLTLADRNLPARRALDRAVDAARRSGVAPGFAFAAGWRCLLYARQGSLADAEADARSCIELSLAQGWFAVAPMTLGFALEVLLDRGHIEEAEQVLQQSGMAERVTDHDLTFDSVVHARARLRAAQGDRERAHADLESLDRRGARWNTFPALTPPVLVDPGLVADEPDAAIAGAQRMLEDARAWDTPRAIGMALRALGIAEGGARGLASLGEAVRVLETSPAPLEYARALTDLGSALLQAGRRTAARERLRSALDIADAAGARPLAERARHELRVAGGRPRRMRTSGFAALTASEQRIAGMAADGLTNPEIAQALFVTKKTVEAHLGSAYRKLDIRSRKQLAAALGRPATEPSTRALEP
jgi:DNA-binding CsgD family transcriptional regulator